MQIAGDPSPLGLLRLDRLGDQVVALRGAPLGPVAIGLGLQAQPQRREADIVVSTSRTTPADPAAPLSVDLLLRSTLRHPALAGILGDGSAEAIRLTIVRDDGTPTDLLQIHGLATAEQVRAVERAVWDDLGEPSEPPSGLGVVIEGERSGSLAVTQLILLHHLVRAAESRLAPAP